VLILADDQGWTGTSVAMHEGVPESKSDYYRTPAQEALARQGTRFSSAYAPHPNRSPSRAAIQTGKSPGMGQFCPYSSSA
jgi:arylsulfatase A-like enzyme